MGQKAHWEAASEGQSSLSPSPNIEENRFRNDSCGFTESCYPPSVLFVLFLFSLYPCRNNVSVERDTFVSREKLPRENAFEHNNHLQEPLTETCFLRVSGTWRHSSQVGLRPLMHRKFAREWVMVKEKKTITWNYHPRHPLTRGRRTFN